MSEGEAKTVPDLVVVGCPSMDRLRIGGSLVDAPGGAAFNTALAACRAGISVGLVAAIPRNLSSAIAAAFGPGGIDRGGLVVRNGASPSFHIEYDNAQDATYISIGLGVEKTLQGGDFPDAWLGAPHVHIAPLGASSARQLAFAQHLRERGFTGRLSAGGFLNEVAEDRDATEHLVAECSLFFLNRAEAETLYPSGIAPVGASTLCVTDGSDGVTVYQGPESSHRQPPEVEVVDPTGAGDAFAGGYLAGIISGSDAVAAGFDAAACAVSAAGSTALVKAVAGKVGPRVEVDGDRIQRVAEMLSTEASASQIQFCGFPFPDQNEPWALDCLALATLHQYGFWYSDDSGWTEPMYSMGSGQRFKGSDFVWQAFTRAAANDPSVLEPARLAAESDLFERICAADNGRCPIPQIESHRELQQAYGAALLEAGHAEFSDLLAEVADDTRPGAALLDRLAHLPGYAEDPLAKKANLLLIILAARPERFIELRDPGSVTPVVDYHIMRSCLRTGCVQIIDAELRARLEARGWVDEFEEDLIRRRTFDAINMLVEQSGLTQAAVDGFFFTNARANCVETADPNCSSCPAEAECAQSRSLFQPVFRTTAY